jgi:histidine triad (HIT) family protein
MQADCLFCKIFKGEVPSKQVYRDEDVYAFEDIRPVAPVHVLVIPREHIPSVQEVKPENAGLLFRLIDVANRIAEERGLSRDGYRLVTNKGPHAGQSVYHLHFHLLGGRSMGWPPG